MVAFTWSSVACNPCIFVESPVTGETCAQLPIGNITPTPANAAQITLHFAMSNCFYVCTPVCRPSHYPLYLWRYSIQASYRADVLLNLLPLRDL